MEHGGEHENICEQLWAGGAKVFDFLSDLHAVLCVYNINCILIYIIIVHSVQREFSSRF